MLTLERINQIECMVYSGILPKDVKELLDHITELQAKADTYHTQNQEFYRDLCTANNALERLQEDRDEVQAENDRLKAEAETTKAMSLDKDKVMTYGIITKSGSLYVSESCISEHPENLESEIEHADESEPDDAPHQIIPLYAHPSELQAKLEKVESDLYQVAGAFVSERLLNAKFKSLVSIFESTTGRHNACPLCARHIPMGHAEGCELVEARKAIDANEASPTTPILMPSELQAKADTLQVEVERWREIGNQYLAAKDALESIPEGEAGDIEIGRRAEEASSCHDEMDEAIESMRVLLDGDESTPPTEG